MKKFSKEIIEAIGMYHAMDKWLSENHRAENWFRVFDLWVEEMGHLDDLCKKEDIYSSKDGFDDYELLNDDVEAYKAYCREYGYAA